MSEALKGLILSGGKGTRLRPLTYTGAKQLVPLANKPILYYVVEDLVRAGITDIGIVVGETADQIRAAVGDGISFGARITYIKQDHPLGLAHAVKIAEPFLGQSRFVMYLGDNFIRDGIAHLVEDFRRSDTPARILLRQTDEPQNFGVAQLDGDRIVRLVEKPRTFVSDLAVVGIYMFGPPIFEAVRHITPSARGELEITDAIQWLIDHHHQVAPIVLDGWWIDTGKMSDILEANRLVLERLNRRLDGDIDAASIVHGSVVVEAGARVVNSVLRGPLIIGQDTVIENAYVGPFTSIDHHCQIRRCEVECSMILDHSTIHDVETRISESLIGRFVEITRSPDKPRAYKMMLGDHSRVGVL